MEENNIPENSGESEVSEKKAEFDPEVEVLPDLDEEPAEEKTEIPETSSPEPQTEQPENGTKKQSPYPIRRRGVSAATFVTVLIIAVLVTFMTTFVCLNNTYREKYNNLQIFASGQLNREFGEISDMVSKLNSVDKTVREDYLYDIDNEELTDSVLKGYLYGIGDKYAMYYTKEEMEAFNADSNAEMQGIGVSVVYDPDAAMIQVIDVFADSPAEEAGLCIGDKVGYVKTGDGEDDYESIASLGYEMALTHLRGKAGTKAEFIVYRDENFNDPIEFSITRENVTEQTVSYRMSESCPDTGIIRISSFDAKTPEQFKKAVEELTANGASKLVFDVRNNPGGELNSVCTVLDMILPEGPVIRTLDKDGNEEVVYTSDKEEMTLPMAVLANGNTASAGELFTCALKDYKKATVVGVKTFGKGSMQTIRSFYDGTGMKYTYRYYCPPFSDNYDGVGIKPDKEVKLSDEASKKSVFLLSEKEDNQLSAALELLK